MIWISGTRKYFGFGVPPFGFLYIWWAETFKVYTFHWHHWLAVKLFPAGCAQDSQNSAIFDLDLPTLETSGRFQTAESATQTVMGLPLTAWTSFTYNLELWYILGITKNMKCLLFGLELPMHQSRSKWTLSVFVATTDHCQISSKSDKICENGAPDKPVFGL